MALKLRDAVIKNVENVQRSSSKRAFLKDLLSQGYFPHQLPPPFTTSCYHEFLSKGYKKYFDKLLRESLNTDGYKKTAIAEPVRYYLARPEKVRRVLSIPHPIAYSLLCLDIAANWQELKSMTDQSGKSISSPIRMSVGKNNRALGFTEKWEDLPKKKLSERAYAKFVVKADVARFFPSIYTHSIVWAMHTKKTAKSKRNDFSLIGNRVDAYLQKGQNNQTLGIPIGPDSSLLISEIILNRIDNSYRKDLLGMTRVVDDFELYCTSRSDAERRFAKLQDALQEYELELNSQKSLIDELPIFTQSQEVAALRNYSLDGEISEKKLLSFFDLSFKEFKNDKGSGILKYALRHFEIKTPWFSSEQEVEDEHGKEYKNIILDNSKLAMLIDFMCQCILNEPGTIENVLRIYAQYKRNNKEFDRLLKGKLKGALDELVKKHAHQGHSSEIAWALWGYIILNIKIKEEIFKAAYASNDTLSIILLKDLYERGLIVKTKYVNNSLKKVCKGFTRESLFSNKWLLAYEWNVKGWASKEESLYINDSETFSYMKENNVAFYKAPADEDDYISLMAEWNPVDPYLEPFIDDSETDKYLDFDDVF